MSDSINIFYSRVGLLSGKMSDCLDPTNKTDVSCQSGLASISSVMRASQLNGNGPVLFLPHIERNTRFVQMHPIGWGVNRLIMKDHFEWDTFIAPPSLFTGIRDVSFLQSHNFKPVLSNVILSITNNWSEFLENVHFDKDTGIAVIVITSENQPNTLSQVDSMNALLDYVAHINNENDCFVSSNDYHDDNIVMEDQKVDTKHTMQCIADIRTSGCWSPVVFLIQSVDQFDLLRAAASHPNPPILFVNEINIVDSVLTELAPNFWSVGLAKNNDGVVEHLRIKFDDDEVNGTEDDVLWKNKMRTVSSVKLFQTDIKNLPLKFKDKKYISDQIFLRSLADQALENDPVVGYSTFMPYTRFNELRMCMGGECPIGNLFTSALRWAADADIAVISSGGLRGLGWPEGPVRVGDIWTALPFANFPCTGIMSGVSVFRMLNFSSAVSTFESTYTNMGDRLLQMSGMRMSYNTLIDGAGLGRLISVDVWDKEEHTYLPLERLKLYKFATENWLCKHFDPYPSLLGNELIMEGEVAGFIDNSRTVQDIVGEYLSSLDGPFNATIQGKHVNNTDAYEPMAFIQTLESCLIDYFWETKTLTCVPCPGGKYVTFSDKLISVYIGPNTTNFVGRNILSNREVFNVTIAPKSNPSWVVSKDLAIGSTVLLPGDDLKIDFDINPEDLVEGNTRSTVSFGIVLDGEYPGCLTDRDVTFDVLIKLSSGEDLNQIDSIRPVGLSLMVLAAGLAITLSIWTFVFRKDRVVKASQPMFLQLICFGTFIMATAIVPLSIDDGIASQRGCDIACMATPWLISTGFAFTFSSLFSKTWRINKVIGGAKACRKVTVKERDVLAPFIVVFSVNCILLLCWTIIDPMRWFRQPINEGDLSNTFGLCKSTGNASKVFAGLVALTNLVALILACVQAYRARKLNDEYSESRWVLVACASWIQVVVIGIPVMLLTQSQPTASYFTKTAFIFLICVSMLVLMFVPKMYIMRQSRIAGPNFRRQSSVYRSGTGSGFSTGMSIRDTFSDSIESSGITATEPKFERDEKKEQKEQELKRFPEVTTSTLPHIEDNQRVSSMMDEEDEEYKLSDIIVEGSDNLKA